MKKCIRRLSIIQLSYLFMLVACDGSKKVEENVEQRSRSHLLSAWIVVIQTESRGLSASFSSMEQIHALSEVADSTFHKSGGGWMFEDEGRRYNYSVFSMPEDVDLPLSEIPFISTPRPVPTKSGKLAYLVLFRDGSIAAMEPPLYHQVLGRL